MKLGADDLAVKLGIPDAFASTRSDIDDTRNVDIGVVADEVCDEVQHSRDPGAFYEIEVVSYTSKIVRCVRDNVLIPNSIGEDRVHAHLARVYKATAVFHDCSQSSWAITVIAVLGIFEASFKFLPELLQYTIHGKFYSLLIQRTLHSR